MTKVIKMNEDLFASLVSDYVSYWITCEEFRDELKRAAIDIYKKNKKFKQLQFTVLLFSYVRKVQSNNRRRQWLKIRSVIGHDRQISNLTKQSFPEIRKNDGSLNETGLRRITNYMCLTW